MKDTFVVVPSAISTTKQQKLKIVPSHPNFYWISIQKTLNKQPERKISHNERIRAVKGGAGKRWRRKGARGHRSWKGGDGLVESWRARAGRMHYYR